MRRGCRYHRPFCQLELACADGKLAAAMASHHRVPRHQSGLLISGRRLIGSSRAVSTRQCAGQPYRAAASRLRIAHRPAYGRDGTPAPRYREYVNDGEKTSCILARNCHFDAGIQNATLFCLFMRSLADRFSAYAESVWRMLAKNMIWLEYDVCTHRLRMAWRPS